ncbi:MerR family DNA-binding transcriptional regulator [Mesobacillus selenatarsenatis]|uniref:Transcriptional regulator, MerR family n=1 Tax=Mesobacillus selenatarsenatis (strain DSM 18680 / JCM 14380 / FERM P-15431 / SF-1) TaxID=1321606 RepID=A0A0A8X6D6_MESS1|nr:MerR family transcriptional regulator [Mesobacillus selenatarsenatis]GAM15463.1 transcriptional regulator, MerR family [Mesobacillus selenatarsenatis SF-1]
MYKVSEFSKMTGLSKETLRYYAEIKLLEPVFIDPNNKYRYYDNGSYLVALLLVHLRRFNFTIQEMLTVVNDESFENLEQILLKKRQGLVNQVQELNNLIEEMDDFFEFGMEGKEDD